MNSTLEKKFKGSGLVFWLGILIVALVFMFINESKDGQNGQIQPAHSSSQQSNEEASPTADTAEAPKIITDSKDQAGNLSIPFSRVLKTAPVNDLLIDPRGTVWVATENGISAISNDQVVNYSIDDGSFPFAQAECLAYDGKQLWAGTLSGLCQQNEAGRFVRAANSDTLPSQIIWSLLWDGTTIWAGTQNGAAFLTPSGIFQVLDETTTNSGLRNNWCKSIARFSSWFVAAHDRGLSIWNTNFPAANPEMWKNIDHARSVISRPVTDMTFDGRNLWIATARGVLLLTTPVDKFFSDFVPNLVSYSRVHGLQTNRVNAIIAHRDAIWLGTDEGLARIKDERIQLISADSGNFARKIRKLAASGDILWIGTDKGVQFINTAMVD